MSGEDNENSESTLTSIIGAPIQFVKSIIPDFPGCKETEVAGKAEMVGDKLRGKKLKTKRHSSPINKHSSNIMRRRHLGSNRSVVRYIGSNVPIAPSKRAYFELFDHSRKAFMSSASTFISANLDQVRQHVDQVKHNVVPTLADIGQLVWNDLNVFDEEEEEEEEEEEADNQLNVETESEGLVEKTSRHTNGQVGTKDTTKISALEDELAKLRAQIAMIVSAQSAPLQSQVTTVAPCTVAPPPPPPPPPIPNIQLCQTPIINGKKNGKEKNTAPTACGIDDILKGIATIKLKKVDINRSPGGTPMKKYTVREDSNNPADIIARALRQKFQKSKMCYESPEKECSPQSAFTPSPQNRKQKKSPKILSTMARPVPRPRPRHRTQKRITKTDKVESLETKSESVTELSFS